MKQFLCLTLLIAGLGASAADEEKDKDSVDENTQDAEVSAILNNIGYPELQVVPRASERLAMEARSERSTWFITHWPMQLSGLATIYIGATSKSGWRTDLSAKEKSNGQTFATVATAVGGGTLLGGLLLGLQKPYWTGAQTIAKIKGKDERSALLRERLAEEALERPVRTMRVLTWVSIITNAAANTLLVDYSTDKGKVTAGLGVVLAFLPLMFRDHSIDVWEKHIEYKKKIYAPLKTSSLSYDPQSRSLTPMTHLVWLF